MWLFYLNYIYLYLSMNFKGMWILFSYKNKGFIIIKTQHPENVIALLSL